MIVHAPRTLISLISMMARGASFGRDRLSVGTFRVAALIQMGSSS
jgi:hypothetical protein